MSWDLIYRLGKRIRYILDCLSPVHYVVAYLIIALIVFGKAANDAQVEPYDDFGPRAQRIFTGLACGAAWPLYLSYKFFEKDE